MLALTPLNTLAHLHPQDGGSLPPIVDYRPLSAHAADSHARAPLDNARAVGLLRDAALPAARACYGGQEPGLVVVVLERSKNDEEYKVGIMIIGCSLRIVRGSVSYVQGAHQWLKGL